MSVCYAVWFRSTAHFVVREQRKKMFMYQIQSRNGMLWQVGENPVVIQKAPQGLK